MERLVQIALGYEYGQGRTWQGEQGLYLLLPSYDIRERLRNY